jgi:hypothetical protein
MKEERMTSAVSLGLLYTQEKNRRIAVEKKYNTLVGMIKEEGKKRAKK